MKPLGTVRPSNALHSCPRHRHEGAEPSQSTAHTRRQAAGGMRQGNAQGRQAHRKARLQQQAQLEQARFQRQASPSTAAAPACMSCCSRLTIRSGLTTRRGPATPWSIEGGARPWAGLNKTQGAQDDTCPTREAECGGGTERQPYDGDPDALVPAKRLAKDAGSYSRGRRHHQRCHRAA